MVHDAYTAVEAANQNNSGLTGRTLWVTGNYGAGVTANGVVVAAPLLGNSFDGGDGVFWWFRFYVEDKNASSTGYKCGFKVCGSSG